MKSLSKIVILYLVSGFNITGLWIMLQSPRITSRPGIDLINTEQ